MSSSTEPSCPSSSPSAVPFCSSSHLSRYSTLLFDCDGVLWQENEPIAGAADTLKRLQSMGKRLLFATNNSGKSRETNMEKFKKLGFDIDINRQSIFTSSQAAADYISQLDASVFDKETQKVLTVGESGIGIEMREKGIQCIESMNVRHTAHEINPSSSSTHRVRSSHPIVPCVSYFFSCISHLVRSVVRCEASQQDGTRRTANRSHCQQYTDNNRVLVSWNEDVTHITRLNFFLVTISSVSIFFFSLSDRRCRRRHR